MSTPPSPYDSSDPIIARLEDQIKWYDAKSSRSQRIYRRIKVTEIIAAALIPFLSALHLSDVKSGVPVTIGTIVALLGVLITVLEGILQLNQYQHIWITYRATCEAMQHEKFTYIARAGVYATATDSRATLAERMEAIGSQENTKWASLQQQPARVANTGEPVPADTSGTG